MTTKKLSKVTAARTPVPTRERERWYDDGCGTAMAMELVGERWSLLIVRELLFGARRFGELRRDLPGISANTLTQRLAGLEESGIVLRRELPPPASVHVYELTEWGYESETAIQELGRWAVRSRAHDPTLPLSPASLMMSFRTMFDAVRAGDFAATVGIELGREGYVAVIGPAGLSVLRSDTREADVVLRGAPGAIAAVIYGGQKLSDAIAQTSLTLTGERAVATRFVQLFPLPPKA